MSNRLSSAPKSIDWARAEYLRIHEPATSGDLCSAGRTLLSWRRYELVYAPFDGQWNPKTQTQSALLPLLSCITQRLDADIGKDD